MSTRTERTAREAAQIIREGETAEDEALNTEERTVIDHNGSPYVNPTRYGAQTLDLQIGDKVDVHTFADPRCIVITFPEQSVEDHPVEEAIADVR